MRLGSVLLVLVLAACGPATPGTDAGVDCRDTTRTPASLLPNWNFECGASPWAPVFGDFALAPGEGRGGGAAGKLTVTAAGGRFTYQPAALTNGGTKTYCLQAWVKGSVPFIRMRALLDFDGRVQEYSFSEALGPDWKKTPPVNPLRIPNESAPKLLIVFEAQTNRTDGQSAVPGQTLFVDDVDLWETSGTCTEAR